MGELLRQVESKDAASGMSFHTTFYVLVKSTELKKKMLVLIVLNAALNVKGVHLLPVFQLTGKKVVFSKKMLDVFKLGEMILY